MNSTPLVARMQEFGATIFGEMSALAQRTGAINLGQGFPDTDGPAEVLEAARAAIASGANQYPPAAGIPELRAAIASHQKRFYDIDVDADDVLVTVGATEGIAAAILAVCEAGDEVVVFEPTYDSYAASIALSGARRRTVPLRFPDYDVDDEALRAAVTDSTKVLLLNNPHNPTGKVFTPEELEAVAAVAREHDLVVISDEVYEHLTFDGRRHVPIATLPGMWERTLTVSSAGKTFSVTGWKVGWISGPSVLVDAVRRVKQFLTYVGSGPFQPAVAVGLRLPESFFTGLAAQLQAKRDLLLTGLREAGLPVSVPGGTYFVTTDVSVLGTSDAAEFSWSLPQRCGVVGVPVSVFCDDAGLAPTIMRFAFCKQDAVLRDAADRLGRLSRSPV